MSEENQIITIRADEVLMYLNHLGYKNISAKVLKEFLTGKLQNIICKYLCFFLFLYFRFKEAY